jgi:hypothetical protein
MKHPAIRPLRHIRYAITAITALAAVAVLATPAVLAQDDTGEMTEGMSAEGAEMVAMMEAWAKAATPGDMHEHIGRSEGEWTTTMKMWMAPDTEPMTSEGTMTGEWLYGGRYLRTRHTGDMMGQPFEGTGFEAYDNVRETFVSTWFDNMSTGIMIMEGHCVDDACDKMEYEGEFADPMTGEMMTHRMVFTWHDDGSFLLEGFTGTPDGEMKGMEMTATKK